MPAEINKIKEKLRLGIRARKRLLVQQEDEMSKILESDPKRSQKEREENRRAVATQVAELQGRLDACRPYITRIKSLVPKISDETVEAASYLLFCKAAQHFEAIFLLTAEGLNIQACELIRAICEALDLIVLVLVEGPDRPNLKKWFDGEIISNEEAREAAHRFLNQGRSEMQPVKETKAGIYAGLSTYSHMSYAALMDSIDVYARDFDWNRVAGFHYSNVGSLPFAKEMLQAMIITLKQFYRFHLRDEVSFWELNKIHDAPA